MQAMVKRGRKMEEGRRAMKDKGSKKECKVGGYIRTYVHTYLYM